MSMSIIQVMTLVSSNFDFYLIKVLNICLGIDIKILVKNSAFVEHNELCLCFLGV